MVCLICHSQDTYFDSEAVSLKVSPMSVVWIIGKGPVLKLPSPNAAGSAASGVDKNRSYLNYMSVAGSGMRNKITIAIANPNIPNSTFLYVQVDRGNAVQGKPGIPVTNSWVALSNNPSDLVRGIESCYTGNGPETGHLLKYRWQVSKSEYNKLVATIGEDIVINFTITADI